jgi:hypothetical protein
MISDASCCSSENLHPFRLPANLRSRGVNRTTSPLKGMATNVSPFLIPEQPWFTYRGLPYICDLTQGLPLRQTFSNGLNNRPTIARSSERVISRSATDVQFLNLRSLCARPTNQTQASFLSVFPLEKRKRTGLTMVGYCGANSAY